MKMLLSDIPGYPKVSGDFINGSGDAMEWRGMPAAGDFTRVAMQHHEVDRELLLEVLREQYKDIDEAPDLEALCEPTTFTVCTGQQLCMAMGPLFVLYKILHTISVAKKLNESGDGNRYIPLFWMATEDHDIEEISTVQVCGKTLEWQTPQTGAAGRLSVGGMELVLSEMGRLVDKEPFSREWMDMLSQAYHDDLASSYRRLLHRLFGKYGLVVLDADDRRLKASFADSMADDAAKHTLHRLVGEEMDSWRKRGFKAVVNPRSINLFLLDDGKRTRIIHAPQPGEISDHPERYSPNVLLRPVYQEHILPNVAYVAGPAELAYWLQLRTVFSAYGMQRPLLLPRASFTLLTPKQERRMADYGLRYKDLFSNPQTLANSIIGARGDFDIMGTYSGRFEGMLREIREELSSIDSSLGKAVNAAETRMRNELEALQAKYVKALKRNHETDVRRLEHLHEIALPGGKPQERVCSMVDWYVQSGPDFVDFILGHIDPMGTSSQLLVLEIEK